MAGRGQERAGWRQPQTAGISVDCAAAVLRKGSASTRKCMWFKAHQLASVPSMRLASSAPQANTTSSNCDRGAAEHTAAYPRQLPLPPH